jgi:hypothetical protein
MLRGWRPGTPQSPLSRNSARDLPRMLQRPLLSLLPSRRAAVSPRSHSAPNAVAPCGLPPGSGRAVNSLCARLAAQPPAARLCAAPHSARPVHGLWPCIRRGAVSPRSRAALRPCSPTRAHFAVRRSRCARNKAFTLAVGVHLRTPGLTMTTMTTMEKFHCSIVTCIVPLFRGDDSRGLDGPPGHTSRRRYHRSWLRIFIGSSIISILFNIVMTI